MVISLPMRKQAQEWAKLLRGLDDVQKGSLKGNMWQNQEGEERKPVRGYTLWEIRSLSVCTAYVYCSTVACEAATSPVRHAAVPWCGTLICLGYVYCPLRLLCVVYVCCRCGVREAPQLLRSMWSCEVVWSGPLSAGQ